MRNTDHKYTNPATQAYVNEAFEAVERANVARRDLEVLNRIVSRREVCKGGDIVNANVQRDQGKHMAIRNGVWVQIG